MQRHHDAAGEALQRLRDGNRRFMEGKPLHSGQDIARSLELAGSQAPQAAILGCSDSRVAPELIFDLGLGELFVIRVAGNILDPQVIGSLEYAVEHLKVKLLVIMGHESCGAIKATLAAMEGSAPGSENLEQLIERIRPHLERYLHGEDPGEVEAAMYHVLAIRRELVRESAIIRAALTDGHVDLVPAFFRLHTGKVTLFPSTSPLNVVSANPEGGYSCMYCQPETCSEPSFARCRLEHHLAEMQGDISRNPNPNE
jgi:carbonic anhydrase